MCCPVNHARNVFHRAAQLRSKGFKPQALQSQPNTDNARLTCWAWGLLGSRQVWCTFERMQFQWYLAQYAPSRLTRPSVQFAKPRMLLHMKCTDPKKVNVLQATSQSRVDDLPPQQLACSNCSLLTQGTQGVSQPFPALLEVVLV